MTWQLDRPQPALPLSFFWTWDNSTNWVLDDPGVVNWGCHNDYLKQPETFYGDFRQLIDLAAGLGIRAIVLWGFLRDAHDGIAGAKRVVDYAAARGVAILPGVGTTHYGGFYLQGDHRFNLPTFLKAYPEARMVDKDGVSLPESACPSHPAFQSWLVEGMQWLFREFAIGGVNLENGDFMVCHCPACKAHKESWPADDPDFFRLQAMSYVPALQAVVDEAKDKLLTYATYTGFLPTDTKNTASDLMNAMHCRRPSVVDLVPSGAIAQWTITSMMLGSTAEPVDQRPLPLLRYLDDGTPADALDHSQWPAGVRPPAARNIGFLHQGSQWFEMTPGLGDRLIGRHDLAIGTIKEGCLRAYRAGLEGVGILGEVTARQVPAALNYLAFSHFIHWPEDSLRGFGRTTLGPVLGSAEKGERFVELLSSWESGKLSAGQQQDIEKHFWAHRLPVLRGSLEANESFRFWYWLRALASGHVERYSVNFF
ncbi:hypothetical protein HQ590_06085 [bacterium]|nr:hypothetical protein [bacterium]